MSINLKKLFVYACCLCVCAALISWARDTGVYAKEPSQVAEASIGNNISPTSGLKQLGFVSSTTNSDEPLKFACEPRQGNDVHTYSGGIVSYCKKKDFAIAENDSARVDIKPGAARAPHWHNTWEQQVLLSGKAKTFVIDTLGKVHTEVLEPGTISFLPAGWTHWTEALGNQTASFIFIFPAGFKTFEVGDSIVNINPKALEVTVGVPLLNFKQNRDAIVMLGQ